MKKKPRVVWMVEKPTPYITNVRTGLCPGMWFLTKTVAKAFGKPVKFVEVT
jgi:hypothetical protein